MNTDTNSIESLKRKHRKLDNSLKRKENECRDIKPKRNAGAWAIAAYVGRLPPHKRG